MDYDVTLKDIATCLGLIDRSYEHRIREDLEINRLPAAVVPEGVLVEAFDERLKMQRVAEVAHLFLPDLLKAHKIASADAWKNPWTSVLLAVGGLVTLYFDRFARDPVEGKAFLDSLYLLYAKNFPATADFFDNTPYRNKGISKGAEACYTARSILGFLTVFNISQSSGTRPPANTSRSALRLVQCLLKLDFDFQAHQLRLRGKVPEEVDELWVYVVQLRALLTGTMSLKVLQMMMDGSPWWRCEAKGAEMGAGPCGKLKAGDEMMACGRCKTVRYCSVAHQKLHWKIHKKTCWEPIW